MSNPESGGGQSSDQAEGAAATSAGSATEPAGGYGSDTGFAADMEGQGSNALGATPQDQTDHPSPDVDAVATEGGLVDATATEGTGAATGGTDRPAADPSA